MPYFSLRIVFGNIIKYPTRGADLPNDVTNVSIPDVRTDSASELPRRLIRVKKDVPLSDTARSRILGTSPSGRIIWSKIAYNILNT